MARLGVHIRGTTMALGLGVGTALATVGCGASEPTSVEAAAAETADTVCTTLRGWNNELTDVFNATSQEITDDDDPATAGGVLVAGFDEMISVAEAHVEEARELELPRTVWSDDLRAELGAGAEESLAVLEDERDEAADLPPIDVDEQGGAIGGASVGVERATSALEPSAGRYDAVLAEAFAADEGCAHVVQPIEGERPPSSRRDVTRVRP
jgi:hypothetical protein